MADRAATPPNQRKYPNILDRPITKVKKEGRVKEAKELEQRLMSLGFDMGTRYAELSLFRDKKALRETKIVGMLQYISTSVWKSLFNRNADSLEKAQKETQCLFYTRFLSLFKQRIDMIYDKEPLEAKFISVPKNLSSLQCPYFTAGIVKGILTAADFPCQVTVHYSSNGFTVHVIEFEQSVVDREQQYASK